MQSYEVGNPESVTQTEAIFFDEMKTKISDLLDDLKNKNYIEKPAKDKLSCFIEIMKMNDKHSEIYNILINIIEKEDKTKQFLKYSEEYGITGNKFAEMCAFTMIDGFNRQTEGFKLAFLIILKKSFYKNKDKMTLGQLIIELNNKSNFSKHITNRLELKLRNVFSHQTYWFDGDNVKYCDDASMQNINKINLSELMKKSKEQNIMYHTFLRVFVEKIKSGFF